MSDGYRPKCAHVHVWYDNATDLADHLEELANNIRGNKTLLVDKPAWLEEFKSNWGGDGP